MNDKAEALRAVLKFEKFAFDHTFAAVRGNPVSAFFFTPNQRIKPAHDFVHANEVKSVAGSSFSAVVMNWKSKEKPCFVSTNFTGNFEIEPALFLPPLRTQVAHRVAELESRGYRYTGFNKDVLFFTLESVARDPIERRKALVSTAKRFTYGVLIAFVVLELPYTLYYS